MGTDTVTPAEVAAMRHALAAAALGPEHGPNPRVGCVVLGADQTVLAVGHHRGAGSAHAEVDALTLARAAGHDVRGGTLLSTLEPCAHSGRTPPCTRAVAEAGITRVVVAGDDPNPRASGGTEVLRALGVQVVTGVLSGEAALLNREWLHAVSVGRPFVTLKWAGTLDGRAAAADGTSRWITGAEARADVHRRRARVDAVLVGTGTILTDDPALTARDDSGPAPGHQPLRVVLGRTAVPAGSRVLDDSASTLHLPTRDLHEALDELHRMEVRHVLVEGGPTVAAAFLAAGLVDEVLAYVAPAVLGSGAGVLGDLGIRTIGDITRLRTTDVQRHGQDVLIVTSPVRTADQNAGGIR